MLATRVTSVHGDYVPTFRLLHEESDRILKTIKSALIYLRLAKPTTL